MQIQVAKRLANLIHQARIQERFSKRVSQYPGAYVIDVTSYSHPDRAGILFSPFYPHGGIPVPFWPGKTSMCVEGIWQGLKYFHRLGIDESKFKNVTMSNLKRSGRPMGHLMKNYPDRLLDYIEARYQIYLPSYKYVLDNYLQEHIGHMKRLASEEGGIVLLDIETNCIMDDTRTPLSHAYLIYRYLLDHWPTPENSLSNYVFLDHSKEGKN